MASAIPKPVIAAIGLVPTVLRGVRRLPTKAVQLPILVLSSALTGLDAAKREYEELAERGERTVGKLRGAAVEPAEEALEPPAGPPATTAGPTSPASPAAAPARRDTAAAPEVVRSVEQATAGVVAPAAAGDLPLDDYDHMTLGALRGRLRSLDVGELAVLRAYEKSKADRLPVITMLDNRIAKLAVGGAAPSAGGQPVKASPAPRPPKNVAVPAPPPSDTSPPHSKVRTT